MHNIRKIQEISFNSQENKLKAKIQPGCRIQENVSIKRHKIQQAGYSRRTSRYKSVNILYIILLYSTRTGQNGGNKTHN